MGKWMEARGQLLGISLSFHHAGHRDELRSSGLAAIPLPQSHRMPPPSSHFFLLIPVHSPQRLYSESVLTTMLQVAGKVQEVLTVLTLRLLPIRHCCSL